MALIIKGDMPKGCNWFDENGKHRFCKVNAFCDCEIYTRGERPSDCPILGEMPDVHGRLKDESVIIQKAEDAFCKLFPIDGKNKQEIASEFHKAFLKAVFDAPTVVEATT